MTYKWTEYEEDSVAEKVPTGFTRLRVSKVIHSKKGGDRFESRNGDPQMMVVCEDSDGREATQMFTLSQKAGWTLARLFDAAGADLEKMEEQGLDVVDFAEPTFAKKWIVGMEFFACVEWETGDNGREYSRIDPKKESELSDKIIESIDKGLAQKGQPMNKDDIPF